MEAAPVPSRNARDRIREEAAILPAHGLQHVAVGFAALTGAAILLAGLIAHDLAPRLLLYGPALLYAVFFALGAWRVRASPGREGAYPWAFLPVLVQAVAAAVVWCSWAYAGTFPAWWDRVLSVAAILSWALLLLGVVVLLPLALVGRRAGLLLAVSALGALWFGIALPFLGPVQVP